MDSTLITIECIDEIADLRGHQAAKSPRSRRPRCAARSTSPQSLRAAWRCSRDCRWPSSSGLRRAARALAGSGADAGRLPARPARRRCSSPAASRSSPTGWQRGSASTRRANTLEIADGKLTGRVDGADRRRASVKAARCRRCASAMRGDDGHRASRSATARTTCRCCEAADVSIAYHAKPIVRAQATLRDRSLRARRRAEPVR